MPSAGLASPAKPEIESHDLDLSFDFVGAKIREGVTVHTNGATDPFELDARDMTISGAAVDGKLLPFKHGNQFVGVSCRPEVGETHGRAEIREEDLRQLKRRRSQIDAWQRVLHGRP